MQFALVASALRPMPNLSELREIRMRESAYLHLVAAGGDPSLDENVPVPHIMSRIPKIGAAVRIHTAHNPTLVNFGLWALVSAPLTLSIGLLAANLLQLEHDCMHHEHALPSAWRHNYEGALVELLSHRFDLVMALFGYRSWPSQARQWFICWQILPALTVILVTRTTQH